MALDAQPAAVGQPAPLFSLPSVQGAPVHLGAYRGRQNVIVWFSRGFTCPFCRVYMDGMREGYELLQAADAEIIQVGPNLLQSARIFFGHSPTPYPLLFFSFQDLDSTKPAGSVKIRVETIAHYLEKYAGDIIEKKKAAMGPGCPLLPAAAEGAPA
jgi:hypothetical protein